MNGGSEGDGMLRLRIRTPEGVRFDLPLASPALRALALLVDLLAIWALSRMLQTVLESVALMSQDLAESVALLSQVALVVGLLMALEWLWRGQTLGKRLFGLRVVDEQGLRLTPRQVLARNVFRLIDMLPGLFLVGGVAAVASRRCQRLGDLVAGTLVIRERRSSSPDLEALKRDSLNSFRDYPLLEARLRHSISPEEARLALDALGRRDQLDSEQRLELFHRLATHFRERVEFPDAGLEGLSEEQLVRDVVESLWRKKTR